MNLKKFIPKKIKTKIKNYFKDSFSQEGEDKILDRYFKNKKNGFYIDIGAHHPFRFSNTYLFYRKGWNGINIDPLENTKKLFDKHRPKDVNLELGISNSEGYLKYYKFNEPALNTFNKKVALKKEKTTDYDIISVKKVKIDKIKNVLAKCNTKKIDFMSIDVEGHEYEVLLSNDWNQYRPKVIVIEILNQNNLNELKKNKAHIFLNENNYQIFAKTINTVFYLDQDIN